MSWNGPTPSRGTLSLVKRLGYAALSVTKVLPTSLEGRDGDTFVSFAASLREDVVDHAELPNKTSLYFWKGLVAPRRGRDAPGLVP
eukprot:4395457-Amphidinium_carterae.1